MIFAPCRAARTIIGLALICLGTASGCYVPHTKQHLPMPMPTDPVPANTPRELQKVTLPPYTIEPPDVLTIDAVRVVPKSPYRVNTLDVLVVNVEGTLPEAPIAGPYAVEPGGILNLGPPYGPVKVVGLTLDEITAAIKAHLQKTLREPEVSVTLSELATKQLITGDHLVGPDGTVTLGSYGSVFVVGMTLPQAKAVIEQHLAQYLEAPEISLSVTGFNSKVYFVITQGAGVGDGVNRFPITGNETVLDAISQIQGLNPTSSKRIWIARPINGPDGCQILPVDWNSITQKGTAFTNYQVLPGDRVYVEEDKLVAFDNGLAKLLAPVERIFGFTLLGTNTVSSIKFFNNRGAFGNNNFNNNF